MNAEGRLGKSGAASLHTEKPGGAASAVKRWFHKDGTWAILLLLPNIIGFLAFTLIPVIASFLLSFTSWDMLSPIRWVGFENYAALLKDETFIKVFWNTIYFAGVSVPVGIVCSLFLAVALDQGIAFKKFYRAAYFLPVVSSMVAVAVVWQFIYNPEYGLLNYALSLIGIKGPNWLTSTVWAMPAVILTSVWKNVGFNMLIFLAGLQGIADSYYEAADLDGARWHQKFWYVTVPLLSPTTFFVTVMSFIGSFQVFDTVFLMTQGGPARSTSVIVHYLYENAFKYFNMGYASAMAYVLFFMVFLITLFQLWRQKKWGAYGG
ncbi:multiple sugar transport system permease protein [Paenibacillus mucilaginosus]|uniref:carbohydrate ABC transporter permease n=1 Tax=Paenibacillus mucilaginosus TaxID=61624 RepID=UPI003D232103